MGKRSLGYLKCDGYNKRERIQVVWDYVAENPKLEHTESNLFKFFGGDLAQWYSTCLISARS